MSGTNGQARIEMPVNGQEEATLNTATLNAIFSRFDWLRKLSEDKVDVDLECRYPQNITAQEYKLLYDRDPIAARVVEVLPKESWQSQPEIYEDEDSDTETEFELAWKELGNSLRGENWFEDEEGSPIMEALRRFDIQTGIGSYGALLFGLDDGKELREPVDGFPPDGSHWGTGATYGQPLYVRNKARKKAKRELLYLRAFPESQALITRYEQERSNPRFGQPVMYQLTIHDPTLSVSGIGLDSASVDVHWSRILHGADNLGSSEIIGLPRMQQVYNRLLDLKKLYGGSAEMYWRGALPGLSIETHPQMGGQVKIDIEKHRAQMQDFVNGLDRFITLAGMTAKSLAPQVVDPTPQIKAQLEAICIILGIPMRIFMGSERGELASGQDDSTWNGRLKDRQTKYLTPRIIVPFVNRLISLGCLPEPKSYHAEWPDLDALQPLEEAQLAATRTEAMAKYVGGGVDALMPPLDYLTRELKYDLEEAESILEAAMEHLEEAAPEAEAVVPGREPLMPEPEPTEAPIKMKGDESLVKPDGKVLVKGKPKPVKAPTRNRKAKGPIANDCGTGSGGFKPGNTCAKGGGVARNYPKARPEGTDTMTQHTSANGQWTPERRALHEEIIAKGLEGKTPVKDGRPVAYLMGGGPAAGKSSILDKEKGGTVEIPKNTVHIDPDGVKAQLPEYQAGVKSGDMKVAAFVHEESSSVSKELQHRASNTGYNTLLDGTGDSNLESLQGKVKVMRDAGQFVEAHYVTVDTDVAVSRSMDRAKKTGRMVPESFIRATHAHVSRTVPKALEAGLFDDFTLWDTNQKVPKAIVTAKGKDIKIHDHVAWGKFLAKGA